MQAPPGGVEVKKTVVTTATDDGATTTTTTTTESTETVCCSTNYCRGIFIGALILMILLFILTLIWFALDFSNTITQQDDPWFALATFILALIGVIIMLVAEVKCNRCFVCT